MKDTKKLFGKVSHEFETFVSEKEEQKSETEEEEWLKASNLQFDETFKEFQKIDGAYSSGRDIDLMNERLDMEVPA